MIKCSARPDRLKAVDAVVVYSLFIVAPVVCGDFGLVLASYGST